MTKTEYQELREYLERRFDEVEKRLEQVGGLPEELRGLRAEMSVGLEAVRTEVAGEFQAVRDGITAGLKTLRG